MRKVYYARAMDGVPKGEIQKQTDKVIKELSNYNIELVDPFIEIEQNLADGTFQEIYRRIVEGDLSLLKTVDAILMDCSIPGRSYVGCICELVYAFLWGIPIVVYTGTSGNDKRYWLNYHATHVYTEWEEVIHALSLLI